MDGVDASDHFEQQSSSAEQTPSLLTVVLDTNPAAWALLADVLPLSKAVADVLVFINAHLACNYTNKVAVIASHSDKAQWLYPTPTDQKPTGPSSSTSHSIPSRDSNDADATSNKRARLNGSFQAQNGTATAHAESNKYRPFRMVEEQLTRNLSTLLASTDPSAISSRSSTLVAGALTLALSYINRETIIYNESLTGKPTNTSDMSTAQGALGDGSATNNASSNALQARILLITVSPSTDLAHQYIPIMNSIFACQRLNIPIDVLQLPLPSSSETEPARTTLSRTLLPRGPLPQTRTIGVGESSSITATGATTISTPSSNSTVFLQQAADATHGIFIPANLTPSPRRTTISTSIASSALLAYLLTAFLPSPNTRRTLILPTRIDVDFRAACFCHRNIISVGFVCSICLSIFCSVPEDGHCFTCGTQLSVSGLGYGTKPVVVPRKKKKKQPPHQRSAVGTPVPA